MSGTPKRQAVQISPEVERRLAEERRRQAAAEAERRRRQEEEARRRREAEEARRRQEALARERQRLLEEQRSQYAALIAAMLDEIYRHRALLLADDLSRLEARVDGLRRRVAAAASLEELGRNFGESEAIAGTLAEALMRKQAADAARERELARQREQQRQAALSRLRAGLEAATARLAASESALALRLDPEGRRAVEQALAEAGRFVHAGDTGRGEAAVVRVNTALDQHLATVAERQALLVRLEARLAGLNRRLAEVSAPERQRFDAEGAAALVRALDDARLSLAAADCSCAPAALTAAEAALTRHLQTSAERLAAWTRQRAAAQAAAGALADRVAAIAADPLLTRWQPALAGDLQQLVETAQAALQQEAFSRPAELLAEAGQRCDQAVAAANQAQLRADRRDYIARALAETLAELGFFVDPVRDEHPGQPGSAKLLDAWTAAGRAIYVSVPAEGEIWYTTEGYPLQSQGQPDGSLASVCDEAETVLEGLRGRVREVFEVELDELLWDGKPPVKRSAAADELPGSRPAAARNR